MLFLLLLGLVVMFLPWRQTIDGEGAITAFTPRDRPQSVQNPIGGRIERWNVQEGDFVKKGDTLLVISDIKDDYFDPDLSQRLDEQLDAKRGSQAGHRNQNQGLNNQIKALSTGLLVKLAAARNKVRQSEFKVRPTRPTWQAIRKNYQIALDRLDRYEKGYLTGLFSLTDLESRRLKVQEDQAKVVSQENKLNVSQQELINARLELSTIAADFQEKIAKAESDRSSAVSYLAEAGGEVAKLRNKISSVDVGRGCMPSGRPRMATLCPVIKQALAKPLKKENPLLRSSLPTQP